MFAMSSCGLAFIGYSINFMSLGFGAWSPQDTATFTAALPAAAKPVADQLYAAATNPWGSYVGFVAGLAGIAARSACCGV